MKGTGYLRRTVSFGPWRAAFCLFLAVFLCTTFPATARTYLNVAIMHEPKNLNPFGASDTWTKKVIRLLYQPLYLVDPQSSALIPWLAEDQPVYDPGRKTVTFHLREMAWDDGTPFGAEDVVFTAEVFKRFKVPKYYAYWKFVKQIEALDKRTVRLTLEAPKAYLFTRTLTSWIIQKRKWAPIVGKADERLKEIMHSENGEGREVEEALRVIQNQRVTKPTGLGPFKLKERKRGKYIFLVKNDRFFGLGNTIGDRVLGPYIDGVIFKVYDTLGAATLALRRGDIDLLWKGVSQAFVKDLTLDPGINVPMAFDHGYRYLAFNLRKSPMSDPAFRRAVAHLIDKDFIIKRILHGHGRRLDSVIPPGNSFYFNPDTVVYGKGMDRQERIRQAQKILIDAGYRWEKPPMDDRGRIRKGIGLKLPDGKPMPALTILTHSAEYDTEIAATGNAMQEWLKAFGIPISRKPMTFRGMMHRIRYERDFDMFIMGWRNLSLDPDYLRRFFHSSYDRPNKRNDTGYNNSEFDVMAERQDKTMDPGIRRGIVLDLQTRLMRDLPYVPLYVPHRMEGIRTDRFKGWVPIAGGVGNIWTYCSLSPTGN